MKLSRQQKSAPKLFLHLKPKAKLVPVNAKAWSECSKRSQIIGNPPAFYEDTRYQCCRCGQYAIFTAEEQQTTFEVRKAYIWQRRQLCPACWERRLAIEQGIRKHQALWRTDKTNLRHNHDFIAGWLALLEEHVHYGGRRNKSAINMLRRLTGSSS